jgi:hypothetical protein
MKYKVDELIGARLDQAVAMAEGHPCGPLYEVKVPGAAPTMRQMLFAPSTDWSAAGRIIDRERISINGPDEHEQDAKDWRASMPWVEQPGIVVQERARGPTALVAAMRVWVAYRLGREVDLP